MGFLDYRSDCFHSQQSCMDYAGWYSWVRLFPILAHEDHMPSAILSRVENGQMP